MTLLTEYISGSSRPSLLGSSYCQSALPAYRSHYPATYDTYALELLLSDSSQIPSLLGQLAPFGSRWYKNHGINSHTERGWLSVGFACWALSLGLHLASSFKKYVGLSTRFKHNTILTDLLFLQLIGYHIWRSRNQCTWSFCLPVWILGFF